MFELIPLPKQQALHSRGTGDEPGTLAALGGSGAVHRDLGDLLPGGLHCFGQDFVEVRRGSLGTA